MKNGNIDTELCYVPCLNLSSPTNKLNLQNIIMHLFLEMILVKHSNKRKTVKEEESQREEITFN